MSTFLMLYLCLCIEVLYECFIKNICSKTFQKHIFSFNLVIFFPFYWSRNNPNRDSKTVTQSGPWVLWRVTPLHNTVLHLCQLCQICVHLFWSRNWRETEETGYKSRFSGADCRNRIRKNNCLSIYLIIKTCQIRKKYTYLKNSLKS